MPSVLAYWDIRGLAQPIRLLLEYVGEDFEDKKYVCGPAPDFNRDSWLNVKNTLGLDFPNLPYYIDEEVKMTQSNAIIRYIGQKYNLSGKTTRERARVEMMLEEAMDIRNNMVRTCYNPKFKELKDGLVETGKKKFDLYEKFIGDGNFFAGDEVTIADFHIYEMLDQYEAVDKTILETCPKLQAFKARFEALPAIKKYMESERFMKWPLNNRMAAFGN